MRSLLIPSIAMAAAVVNAPASGAAELHDVTYTVYSDEAFPARIYYRDAEPPNFAEYSHDPYRFSPVTEAVVGPAKPWVLSVKLTDPGYWAMVVVTSGQSAATPNFHCSIAVDGTVVTTGAGAKGALCALRHW